MPQCKHCNREYSTPVLPLHEARCKENPTNKPKPKPKKTTAKKTTSKTAEKK